MCLYPTHVWNSFLLENEQTWENNDLPQIVPTMQLFLVLLLVCGKWRTPLQIIRNAQTRGGKI